MDDLDRHIAGAQKAGHIRKRVRGGYKMTRWGWVYIRDRLARYPHIHAELTEGADRWEAGTMTKTERREFQVRLVLLTWEADTRATADAVASLRAQGFDPLSAEMRARVRDELGYELPEE